MMLEIDEKWYQAEERDGFLVEEEMKRAWAEQMEVLKVFEKVCNDYGLHYFAYFGTLLGAVRHQGFIPWDDDLDVAMLRQDFVRFEKIAAEVLPEGYYVRHWKNDEETDQIIMRVINGTEVRFTEAYLKEHHRCPYAAGLDIFPIDWIPDDDAEMEVQKNLLNLANSVRDAWNNEEVCYADKRYMTAILEDATGVPFDETGNTIQQGTRIIDAVSAMYGPQESTHLGIPFRALYAGDQRYPKEWFSGLIMQPFEMIEMPIPIGYHEILTNLYGDYTEKRQYIAHDYPFYAPQKKMMEEYFASEGVDRKDIIGY